MTLSLSFVRSNASSSFSRFSIGIFCSLAIAGSAVAATTLSRTSAFEYDATSGLLTKEIIEPGNSNLCQVTVYSYDSFGNKTSSTTRNCNGSTGEAAAPTGDAVIANRTVNNVYDARGQFPLTSQNALSQSETKTYDAKTGALLSLQGPNGLATSWQYDGFGRKILETRADGTKTKWEYIFCNGVNGGTESCPVVGGAAASWFAKETPLSSDGVTQNGPESRSYFDSLNREIRKETQGYDGAGTATAIYLDTRYDSRGRSYMVSRPYYKDQTAYWTTITYDNSNRVIQETRPDNTTSSTQYSGLVKTTTDAKAGKTIITSNGQGLVTKVVDALNNTTTHSYDPLGNLVSTLDPLGNVISLTYDLRGRKIQMVAPDVGTLTYAYNAIGELIRTTDAKAQVTSLTYDKLGRLTQRNEADLISNWYYDTYKGGGACNKGIGKLCQSETSTGYNKTLTYDSLGRQVSSAVTIDVPTPYRAAFTYDANGRIQTQAYPSGLTVKYVYTTLGYLKEVRNNTSNSLYWKADTLDAEGHLTQQTYGNGIQATQSYDPATGRITVIQAGAGNAVQNLSYQYDALSSLTSRNDAIQNLSETFLYDKLNRLTSATVNSSGAGLVTQTYAYDALGNITSKSDLGSYTYADSIRPHAVSKITLNAGGSISFTYDANGALSTQTQVDASNNVIVGKSRSLTYTSFGMAQSFVRGTASVAFYYGPEHQRIKQISTIQGTTVYVNPGNEGALSYEKDIRPDGSIEQRNFITASGQVVAIVKYTTTGGATTVSTRYTHRDNLGSVTAITDESGTVVERLAFDAFGKRRMVSGVADPNGTILPQTTDRGYTDHEMIDELGLINMNGRMYDPMIGRFLSADPLIQAPYNLQSLNRYSYVLNNPLMYTDPSGYNWWTKIRHTVIKVVALVADVYGCSGYCSAAVAAYDGYKQTGSIAKGLKAGLISYATYYAFNQVGNAAQAGEWGTVARVGAHAVVGCASSVASGGKCGPGALAAGFGELATINGPSWVQKPNGWAEVAAGVAYTSVVGGTASVLGGGKFENGATTAAFGYLFNHLNHFDRGSTQYSVAEEYENKIAFKSTYNVYGHANGYGFYADGKLLSVDSLAAEIRSDPEFREGDTVKIWSCNLAEANVYVQNLANSLNSPVVAANGYVWYQRGSAPYSATRSIDYLRIPGMPDSALRNRFIGGRYDYPVSPAGWTTTYPSSR